MTNFEKYKEKIDKIKTKHNFAVDFNDNVVECDDITCSDCIFKTTIGACTDIRTDWLFEEAEILTEKEKELINTVNSMRPEYYKFRYIARNVDNNLFLFTFEPYLTENKNYKSLGEYDKIRVDKNLFKNITYETGVFDIELNKFIKIQED